MAQREQPELTAQLILKLLEGQSNGLTATEVIEKLQNQGSFSPRAIRNLLNELMAEGTIIRTKQWSKAAGKPPFAYFHPNEVPRQLSLIDQIMGVKTQIQTKTELEREQLSSEDRKSNEEAQSVLERIAREHIQSDRYAWAIAQVAPQLAQLNPVDLLLKMVQWVVSDINALADQVEEIAKKDLRQAEELASKLEMRLDWVKRYFQQMWRLDNKRRIKQKTIPGILELPSQAKNCKLGERAFIPDLDAVYKRLKERVRGDFVIEQRQIKLNVHKAAAGTDASVADIFLEHRQGSFVPPDPVAVTTAAAALISHEGNAQNSPIYLDFDIFPDQLREYGDHRAASEGLLLSPALKQVLPEKDFKHSRMAAMDLRQYLEDLRVLQKNAKWRPIGNLPTLDIMPKASLIFRDGRIFPLVHRIDDYESSGLYGQIVRKEIETFSYVVQPTLSGPASNVVYAAAVKDPEMSFLAPMIFWYLYHQEIKFDNEVVATREDIYSVPFGDTAVAHLLFLGLAKKLPSAAKNDSTVGVFVTFRGVRRFSDIGIKNMPPILYDESRRVDENNIEDWYSYVRERVTDKENRGEDDKIGVDEYDPFTYLLTQVGASMCYAAPASIYEPMKKSSSGSHFLLPRLEVAIDIQNQKQEQDKLDRMLSWLASGHFCLDDENGTNFLVPDVTFKASKTVEFERDCLSQKTQDTLRNLLTELRRFCKN
jgi:predicted transcriptional regulator